MSGATYRAPAYQPLLFGDFEPELDCTRWEVAADGYIRARVRDGNEATADDVRRAVGEPCDPHAWGRLFARLAEAGVIHRVGWTQATTPSSHRRYLGRWAAGPALDTNSTADSEV